MATVSEQLRQAREEQELTIQQAAEVTKIRGDHLRALEEGNFDIFAAPVYIKGFVRSYSNYLKLDAPQVMANLEAELSQTTKFAEPPPLSDSPRGFLDFVMLQLSRLDWRKGVVAIRAVAIFLVVMLIVFISRHLHRSDPLAGLKPGVYHSTQTVSGDTLPIPPVTPARR